MKTPTGSQDRLIMLLACGSPGSAAAFHQLPASSEADLVQRRISVVPVRQGAGLRAWFARVMQPLRESAWDQELRDREAFLSGAQNVFDLESRMRSLEGAVLARSRVLG